MHRQLRSHAGLRTVLIGCWIARYDPSVIRRAVMRLAQGHLRRMAPGPESRPRRGPPAAKCVTAVSARVIVACSTAWARQPMRLTCRALASNLQSALNEEADAPTVSPGSPTPTCLVSKAIYSPASLTSRALSRLRSMAPSARALAKRRSASVTRPSVGFPSVGLGCSRALSGAAASAAGLFSRRRRCISNRRRRVFARRRRQCSCLRDNLIRRTAFEHRTHHIETRGADKRGSCEGRDRSEDWSEYRRSPQGATSRCGTRDAAHCRHCRWDGHARCDVQRLEGTLRLEGAYRLEGAQRLDRAHRNARQRCGRRRSAIGPDVTGQRPAVLQ